MASYIIPITMGQEIDYSYELTQVEQSLQSGVLSKLAAIDPTRKFMTFGFITDLHESYDDVPYSFGGDGQPQVITAKHALRLLGSIAHEYGMDAVLMGGDYSLGGDLTYSQYDDALDELVDDVRQNISVKRYATEGNHDRKYNSNVACRGNADWLAYLKRINSSGAVYIDNSDAVNANGVKPYDGEVGNTYYVDFPAYKVRVIMLSRYEKVEQGGDGCFYKNLYDSLKITNADEWSVLVVTHFYDNKTDIYLDKFFNAFLGNGTQNTWKGAGTDQFDFSAKINGDKKGLAVVGQIYGHVHSLASHTMADGKLKALSVWNAFATKRQDGAYQSDDYHFSVFVVDTDNWMLHEIKVGKLYDTTDNEYYDSTAGVFSYPIKHNEL